jgi:hypothetical protein
VPSSPTPSPSVSPTPESEEDLAPDPPADRTGLALLLGSLVTLAGLGTAAVLYVTGRRGTAG